jgi:hypothetical protein
MIDYIVGLFYNHRYVRLAIKQTVYYCILIYLFGLLLDLYLTKVIHFNFFVWSESFHENSTAIVLILVGITLLFMTISIYFYNQIHQKKKIKIKLEDIAHIWTNEIDDNDDIKVNKEYKHSPFLIRTINDKEYNSKRLKRFHSELIINNMKYFKDGELYLIMEILTLLDENLKVSSVPSYDKDKENIYLESQNYFKEYNSGKSNVELLSKISLIEHTINVTHIAIKEFEEIAKKEPHTVHSLHLATVLITAIAHDIGKIKNPKMLKIVGFDDVITKDMHHVDLSIEYFKSFVKNLGFYEENEIVTKAIQEHHSSTLPTAKLSKILFTADKEARKFESKELITKLKEDAEETIKKYEREQIEIKNNEQIEKLKMQLAEKDKLIKDMSVNKDNIKTNNILNIENVKEVVSTVNEEDYRVAKLIKESKVVDDYENLDTKKNENFEKLIEEIKSNINTYTQKGISLIMKEKDLLDNPKEFLKSISDENFIYFSYFGLREIFEKIEQRKLSFDEITNHYFNILLKERELVQLFENEQFYGKYEIYTYIDNKDLISNINLIKIPIIKLNLEANDVIQNKENSVMRMFQIREKK